MSIIRPPYTGDAVLDSWTNQITQQLNMGLTPGIDTSSGASSSGSNGNTIIYLYQKSSSASAPAAPTLVSYDYSDINNVTVTANGGWTSAVPATSLKYLWVTFRYVSKLIDTITGSNTWNTPVLLASNGDDGGTGPAGLNNATAFLYKKTTTNSAGTLFQGTFVYSFSTGQLTQGTLNGWSFTAPTLSAGEFLFTSSAVASSTASSVSIAASEFSTPQVTGIAGTNGTDGTNGDVTRTLYLYDASVNQPSAIASNAGFNSSTGNASNTGTWTTTVPSIPAGQGLWIASATITRTNNAGSFVGGGWTIYRGSGYDGSDGPRFATRRFYRAWDGGVPPVPTATITWSTGNAVSTGTYAQYWSLTPPTQIAGSTTIVYFSDMFFVDTSGSATTTAATGSTPKAGTSFSGLVTFNSGDFKLDGSTITTIDGGNITAGSLNVTTADIGNLQVTSAQIADLTVGTLKITGNAVSQTTTAIWPYPANIATGNARYVLGNFQHPCTAGVPIEFTASVVFGEQTGQAIPANSSLFNLQMDLGSNFNSGGNYFIFTSGTGLQTENPIVQTTFTRVNGYVIGSQVLNYKNIIIPGLTRINNFEFRLFSNETNTGTGANTATNIRLFSGNFQIRTLLR